MPAPLDLKLNIGLLTPAFVAGADPRFVDAITPIRVPTLRGHWRWWLRTGLAGALDASLDPARAREALWDTEARLFGTVHKQELQPDGRYQAVARRSLVTVLPPTMPPGGSAEVRLQREQAIERLRANRQSGLGYLGFGPLDAKFGRAEVLPASKPGETITLRLRLDPRLSAAEVDALRASLWLWGNLGGLGARWRRGYGAVVLHSWMERQGGEWRGLGGDSALHALSLSTRDAETWEACGPLLITGITAARKAFRRLAEELRLRGERAAPHPGLRTLAGVRSLRFLPRDWPDPTQALDEAGRQFRSFRSSLERGRTGRAPLPDYHEIKNTIVTGQPPRRVDRAAFGLPLPFFFRSLNGAKAIVEPAGKDRLASPLLFRPLLTRKGATLLLLHFEDSPGPSKPERSDAPKSSTLIVREPRMKNDQGIPAPWPDASIIDDFYTFAFDAVRRGAR